MKATKKFILVIMLMVIALLMLGGSSDAAYQSVPKGTSKTDAVATWVTTIRQMESAGGGMGLQEEVDTTTGLATTEANNIDVHMLKNTEYGAILLLGASDYGKQGTDITARRMDKGEITGNGVQASTTGNKYGIYEMGYFSMNVSYNDGEEWVAGGRNDFLSEINSRYVNRYTDVESSALPGDATVETKDWHGSRSTGWVNYYDYGFTRGSHGAFLYQGRSGGSYSFYARAAVVVGNGI